MLVTIVVPTYNKAPFVTKTLESIFSQTMKDFKLLLIDDGSSDQTVSVVKTQVRTYSERFDIRVIERKRNDGICHVLNHALGLIDTPYFLQVDGDDWIESETLDLLVSQMEKEPETTALAYANTIHWHHVNGIDHFHKKVKHRRFKDRYDFVTYDPMVQPRFYRTRCVRQVGGWETNDPTNGRLMEDRRILLRLLDQFTFIYVNRDLYHYRYHQFCLSNDRNASVYNQLRQLFTDRALKRWGNQYHAEYTGPLHLWQSIRLIPHKRKE